MQRVSLNTPCNNEKINIYFDKQVFEKIYRGKKLTMDSMQSQTCMEKRHIYPCLLQQVTGIFEYLYLKIVYKFQ